MGTRVRMFGLSSWIERAGCLSGLEPAIKGAFIAAVNRFTARAECASEDRSSLRAEDEALVEGEQAKRESGRRRVAE